MSANSAAYQNDKPVDLSLIITCYNDSAILEDNVSKLISYLSCLNLSYELILVEDCSTDNTHEIVVKIEKQHADSGPQPEFKVVKTEKFHAQPLSVSEAIVQLNLHNEPFLVFRLDSDGRVAVVYQRDDGSYGLIETPATA